MIEVVSKKFFIHKDIWFPEDKDYSNEKCDVCCIIGTKAKTNGAISSKHFHSLISDLKSTLEQLNSNFEWTTKYDIRRSEKDNLQIVYYDAKQILNDNEMLTDFALIYNEMYKMKGLSAIANVDAIKTLAKVEGTLITCAKDENLALVYHVYVVDGKHARLWMSTSIFRENEDKQFRAKVGRANKRLHYEDLKYFQNLGYETYDWGGILSFDEPNGIDKFKMSFGGERIDYYDETIICSNRYKIYHKIKSLLKK